MFQLYRFVLICVILFFSNSNANIKNVSASIFKDGDEVSVAEFKAFGPYLVIEDGLPLTIEQGSTVILTAQTDGLFTVHHGKQKLTGSAIQNIEKSGVYQIWEQDDGGTITASMRLQVVVVPVPAAQKELSLGRKDTLIVLEGEVIQPDPTKAEVRVTIQTIKDRKAGKLAQGNLSQGQKESILTAIRVLEKEVYFTDLLIQQKELQIKREYQAQIDLFHDLQANFQQEFAQAENNIYQLRLYAKIAKELIERYPIEYFIVIDDNFKRFIFNNNNYYSIKKETDGFADFLYTGEGVKKIIIEFWSEYYSGRAHHAERISNRLARILKQQPELKVYVTDKDLRYILEGKFKVSFSVSKSKYNSKSKFKPGFTEKRFVTI